MQIVSSRISRLFAGVCFRFIYFPAREVVICIEFR